MSFHNSMNKGAAELAARYERKTDIIEMFEDQVTGQYRISAFNYPKCAAITNDEQIQVFNWGLIPHWVGTEEDAKDIRSLNLNARAETLFQKPSFRDSILSRRCLIPSTGYFECRHENGKKIPYFIFLKNMPVFSMAAVYDIWTDKKTQSGILTFSLITTEPNPLTAYIHNTKRRMPAILSAEDEGKWLDSELNEKGIRDLLQPYPMEEMEAYEIEENFMKKKPSDPSIIEKTPQKHHI